MRLAVASASGAVKLLLQQLIKTSGHTLDTPENAAWVIEDTLHPESFAGTAKRLRLGSDISLPVRPVHLLQQLMALGAARIAFGQWQLDPSSRQLQHADGRHMAMTEKEILLLQRLHHYTPQPAPRDQLLKEVWGMGEDIDTHTLETHIYRLRNKLGELADAPCDIVTEGGAYRLLLK